MSPQSLIFYTTATTETVCPVVLKVSCAKCQSVKVLNNIVARSVLFCSGCVQYLYQEITWVLHDLPLLAVCGYHCHLPLCILSAAWI